MAIIHVKIIKKVDPRLKGKKKTEQILNLSKEAIKSLVEKFGPVVEEIRLWVTDNPIRAYFKLLEQSEKIGDRLRGSIIEEISTFTFYEKGKTPTIIIDINAVDPKKEKAFEGLIAHEFAHILMEKKGVDDRIVKMITDQVGLIWEWIPRLDKLGLKITDAQWTDTLLTVLANLTFLVKGIVADSFLVKNGFGEEIYESRKGLLDKKWVCIECMRRYREEKILNQLKEGDLEAFKDLFIAGMGMLTLWLPLSREGLTKEANEMRTLINRRVPIPEAILKHNVKLMRVLIMAKFPPSRNVCKKLVRETLKTFYYSLRYYVKKL